MWHFQHHQHTITIQVFHKHYYDDEAQVKCSLSRSDGDSNRFLTSWRVYSPHKPHSPAKVSYRSPYYTIQDQFAGSTGTARIRGSFRRPRYPRYTKAARRALVVLLNHHQTARTSGRFPTRIVFSLRGRNNLSF